MRRFSTASEQVKRDRNGGFTIMEVMVVTSIFMIVMSSLLTTLDVATRQERRTTAIVDNQNTVMMALAEMTRELRGANPIDVSATVTSPDDAMPLGNSINFLVGSSAGGDRKRFEMEIDAQGRLVKRELNVAGTAVLSERVLIERVVNTPEQPLFRYYNIVEIVGPTGQSDYQLAEIDLLDVLPTYIKDCAIKIRIEVFAQGEPVAPVYNAATEVEIRNRERGAYEGQEVSTFGC